MRQVFFVNLVNKFCDETTRFYMARQEVDNKKWIVDKKNMTRCTLSFRREGKTEGSEAPGNESKCI